MHLPYAAIKRKTCSARNLPVTTADEIVAPDELDCEEDDVDVQHGAEGDHCAVVQQRVLTGEVAV